MWIFLSKLLLDSWTKNWHKQACSWIFFKKSVTREHATHLTPWPTRHPIEQVMGEILGGLVVDRLRFFFERLGGKMVSSIYHPLISTAWPTNERGAAIKGIWFFFVIFKEKLLPSVRTSLINIFSQNSLKWKYIIILSNLYLFQLQLLLYFKYLSSI